MSKLISSEIIAQKIFVIRGHKVMLDRHLSELYEVKTIALRQQVKRNLERFPEDFIFQLNEQEAKSLVSQNVIPTMQSLGGYLPYAFTEQGVAMLSSVLRSKKAVMVNIQIMRTFARLKEFLTTHREFSIRLETLEKKFGEHDEKIKIIFEAIKRLLEPPTAAEKPKIGFHPYPYKKLTNP